MKRLIMCLCAVASFALAVDNQTVTTSDNTLNKIKVKINHNATNMPTFSGGLTVGAGINDPKGIVAALDEDGDTFGLIWVGTNSFDVF